MGLPIQFSDITTAINIIIYLRQNCFGPENQISSKYEKLRDEIEQFATVLECLSITVENYERTRGSVGQWPSLMEKDPSLHFENYKLTLKECQKFLEQHAHRRGRASNWIQNSFWSIHDHEIKTLRRSIHDHYTTANCYLGIICVRQGRPASPEPHSATVELPSLSSVWRDKFEGSLLRDDRLQLSRVEDIPIEQAKESAQIHVMRSQPITSRQSPCEADNALLSARFLHLLKAQYLVELIEVSISNRSDSEGSNSRSWLHQAKKEVLSSHRAFAMPLPEHELLEEWHRDPAIWANGNEPEPRGLSRVDSVALETPMLNIHLSNQGRLRDELRVSKINEQTLEIVRIQATDSTGSTNTICSVFRLHDDILRPQYIFNPEDGLIFQSAGRSIELIPRNWSHLLRLQRAVTGYKVYWPLQAIPKGPKGRFEVLLNGSFKRDRESTHGEVQLWYPPIYTERTPTSPRSITSASSSSPQSVLTAHTQGLNMSIHTVQCDVTGRGVSVTGEMPPPPVLVAFTQNKDVYQMWRIDLEDKRLEIKEKPDLIEVKSQGDPLLVRRLTVKGASNLDKWNLCAISLPNHPHFNDTTVVERFKAKSVTVYFDNADLRGDFRDKLGTLLALRDEQQWALNVSSQQARAKGSTTSFTKPQPKIYEASGGSAGIRYSAVFGVPSS